MAKRTRSSRTDAEIQKVEGVDAGFLSAYVEQDDSLDTMREHVVLPRIKIIQAMTDEDLKTTFGEGSAIIRPGDALVAGKDESFSFVPQFFYVEYCKWSDRRDDDNPAIVERTFDSASELAKRAKDPKRRIELYEGEDPQNHKAKKWRWVEHYNFPGIIYGEHPLSGTAVVLSFSKGEHRTGSSLIQAIRLRRETIDGEARKIPLWAQVWDFHPSLRDRGDNKWWGLDFAPAETPIISPDHAEACQSAYAELTELHQAQRLGTDYGDEEDTEEASAPASGKF